MAQNVGVLDFFVLGQKKNFGEDFRRARIVVGKREKNPPAGLGGDGENGKHPDRRLMTGAASEMNRVIAERSVNMGVGLFDSNVTEPKERKERRYGSGKKNLESQSQIG